MEKYSEGLRLLALKVLKKDIECLSRQYRIHGFDPEDTEQELISHLWDKISLYNPYKDASIRTWGVKVLRNKIHDLNKANYRHVRVINVYKVSLDELMERIVENENRILLCEEQNNENPEVS